MGKDDFIQDEDGFWKTEFARACWVCGVPTRSVWLDMNHQHKDCDMYPDDEGRDVIIIRGKEVSRR